MQTIRSAIPGCGLLLCLGNHEESDCLGIPHQTLSALLTTLGTYLQITVLILIVIQTIMLLKNANPRCKDIDKIGLILYHINAR